MLSTERPLGPTPWTDRRILVPALVGWVWARICVGVGFVVANRLTPDPALSAREDFPLPRGLLSWDGFFYERIAVAGYGGTPADGVRFFPGYPFLARLLSPVFGGHADVALVVLANVAALVGAVVLARLALEVLGRRDPGVGGAARSEDRTTGASTDTPTTDTPTTDTPTTGADIDTDAAGAEQVAGRAAWIVAVVPAAIVFVWAYSEGLALVLTAATLLALHRRAFAWAGAFAAAACLIRPTGLLLLAPIVIEVVRRRPRPLPAVAAVTGPLLGLFAALAVIERTTGSWTSAFDAQQPIRGEFRFPLIRAAEALWGLRFNTDTELVPYVVLWFVLLGVSVWRRQPISWIVFSALTLLVACSSQTIDSIGRYGLLAVPLVVALAQWADRNWRTALVGAAGSVGLVLTTVQALQGRIVP